ncbi:MAG TPA: hypothetical protein QGF58_21150 [Myxococcota bacterium]|nr:hypothetical protein [Myxococcota bacterium]
MFAGRRGQSTTEYVLFISVIVIITVWVAGDAFWPAYADGLEAMQTSLGDMVGDGVVEGR